MTEAVDRASWVGDAFVPLTSEEASVLELCTLATTDIGRSVEQLEAADPTHVEFAQSLDLDDGRWRLLLHERLRTTDIRAGLVGFLVAVEMADLPEDAPDFGRQCQRRNGLMDILGLSFSADDVVAA